MSRASSVLTTNLDRLTRTGWRVVDGHHLEKTYSFPGWAEALAFVNRVGVLAETLQHHPDVELGWGRVVLKLRTHDDNGVGELDVELADAINTLPG